MILCVAITGTHAQFITNTGIEINNSALLVTNGDWTNNAGTIINDGTIRTSEAFVNNGTLDKQSLGGFVLNYASDLDFVPGGSQIGFLRKEGTGSARLTGSINLLDSLLIKSGIIRLTSSRDTVALGPKGILEAGATTYIEGGLIARGGTGDMLFPFGKDGLYLPLRMYKVAAQRVTAQVVNAPGTHQAGPGVDALIGFPYAWIVTTKAKTDTAGYVEVNYPNSLPVVGNPIVVREVGSQEYASMGARLIEDSGTRTTVKSYSRRVNGMFSVAQGFPSDPVTDSLALVALYQSTGGSSWTNKTNWRQSTIDTWFGVEVNGQSITAVELPANNLKGPVADQLVDILSLQRVNLSGNEITSIPDFTLNPEITSLNVSDNNLDFGSLEPNADIVGINYLIQGEVGTTSRIEIPVGSSHEVTLPAQGGSSQYQWKLNGDDISGAHSASYVLPPISRETMGQYTALISNPKLPGLILTSAPQTVLAYATLSGKLYAAPNVPAEAGELTLYKVQPGAFEVVDQIEVEADGSYLFDRVILDDYQVRGFADTLLHASALPTYYENTIFWEEADTLQLVNNVANLDIISQLEPGPPSGRGSISGYLQEDDGTGRGQDVQKSRPIAKAGVSARRIERTGRTKDEILTLVVYVFTNENGDITLPNLPTGEYRLNFQYPGYPMDETSYTTITIGTALQSQALVEANVVNGKINVRKLTITGLFEDENYNAEVFPNPAVDHIQLRFENEVTGRTIVLSNMQGKLMHTQSASEREVGVSIRTLPNGIYILQVRENDKKVKTLKISIE
jgi:hypothetical protein